MNIEVEYKDTAGIISNTIYPISKLAFAKHIAIAGQGYAPKPQNFLRAIGMLFHYSYYTQRQAFNNDRFSEPPAPLSDPTEKSQFSNLAGKAIADFLSKRINNSLYTVNYEAAMRMRRMLITGRRPDLIAYTQNSIFAIEAKGFTNGYGNMVDHKNQAQTGGIPVNFTVASVSYDLYTKVKCKYHDPFNDNIPYDNETLRLLTKEYYSGLAEFLNREVFTYREAEIGGEGFYEVELSRRIYDKFFRENLPFWPVEFLHFYRLKILLPNNILELAQNGITNESKPFQYENTNERNIYFDNDRIGLSFDR
jgi:hypothetical protein